jgi:hypothetical protein
MSYKITVTVTATVEKRAGATATEPVGQVSQTIVRTNGSPSERYAVHEIEAAADAAAVVVAKMAEAAYGRSSRPSWEER